MLTAVPVGSDAQDAVVDQGLDSPCQGVDGLKNIVKDKTWIPDARYCFLNMTVIHL